MCLVRCQVDTRPSTRATNLGRGPHWHRGVHAPPLCVRKPRALEKTGGSKRKYILYTWYCSTLYIHWVASALLIALGMCNCWTAPTRVVLVVYHRSLHHVALGIRRYTATRLVSPSRAGVIVSIVSSYVLLGSAYLAPPPPRNELDAVIFMQESPPHERLLVGYSSSIM